VNKYDNKKITFRGNMSVRNFESKTRKIFHQIHKKQGSERNIYDRLVRLLSPDYLQVPLNFFDGKICLDAGCGSNANATYNMLKQGASKVYCFDLDQTIFETVPNYLKPFEGRYILKTDNVLNMSFEDNCFDFVHCSGVLHHASDLFRGLKELARVTKPCGMIYIMTYGKGGLIRDIVTYLRDKYQKNVGFSQFIDNLETDFFTEFFMTLFSSMKAHGDNFPHCISKETIQTLFDDDLVLTIKDRITAPAYHEHDPEEIFEALKNYGFSQITRLTRYPEYKNFRRFLSPLYKDFDSEYAKLLYGSGSIQIKAIKDD